MIQTKASAGDLVAAQIQAGSALADRAGAGGVFTVECRDAQGNLKWSESMHNLVVNVGLKDMNDKYFTGSAYTDRKSVV